MDPSTNRPNRNHPNVLLPFLGGVGSDVVPEMGETAGGATGGDSIGGMVLGVLPGIGFLGNRSKPMSSNMLICG